MAYMRLFRRVQLAPGLKMNISKSGPSLSVGCRGLHYTVGRNGTTKTVGIPGSGVFWTDRSGRHTGIHNGEHFQQAQPHQLAPILPNDPHRTAKQVGRAIGKVIEVLALGIVGIFAVLLILGGGSGHHRR